MKITKNWIEILNWTFLQNIVQDAISGMGEMGRNARVSTRTSVSEICEINNRSSKCY